MRKECLLPADQGWECPTGDEIRRVLKLAGLSGSEAAKVLGLHTSSSRNSGGRTIRRWTSGETAIPYAAWAILCDLAGFGQIWWDSTD